MKTKSYKGIIFKNVYNQWVNDKIGGFYTFEGAMKYIDTIELKKNRLEVK